MEEIVCVIPPPASRGAKALVPQGPLECVLRGGRDVCLIVVYNEMQPKDDALSRLSIRISSIPELTAH